MSRKTRTPLKRKTVQKTRVAHAETMQDAMNQ
jgi:hypothetical protein